jgi:hypothetical protein
MANEQNKQQGQQDQPQRSTNTTEQDKLKQNPSHSGSHDPKNTQDISKKDPSRQSGGELDREQTDTGDKRRAS